MGSLGFLRTRRHPDRIQRLRAVMREWRLTRADVCRILGLTPSRYCGSSGTVDSWLSGRYGIPLDRLEKIEAAAPTYKRPPPPDDGA